MKPDLLVPAGAGTPLLVALAVVVVLALLLTLALVRTRAGARREREAAGAEIAALRARLEEIERRLTEAADERRTARPSDPEFVITRVGDETARPRHAAGTDAPGTVEPALFADLVLRESVVRVASLAHGVRVALSPETRNRIRFEVRREVRRARKQRRTDTKLARREHASRQRAAPTDDEDAA